MSFFSALKRLFFPSVEKETGHSGVTGEFQQDGLEEQLPAKETESVEMHSSFLTIPRDEIMGEEDEVNNKD